MDLFALSQSAEFTNEQVFSRLADDPFQSSDMAALFAPFKGQPYPTTLTLALARVLLASRRHALLMAPRHPAIELTTAAAATDLEVSPSCIATMEPEPVSYVYHHGYFVKDGSSLVALKASMADTLAYTYTPSTPIRDKTVTSNFVVDRSKLGLPQISTSLTVLDTWKKSDTMGNADLVYAQMSTPKVMLQLQSAILPIMESVDKTMKRNVTRKVTMKSETLRSFALFKPLIGASTSEYGAYKMLQNHRAVRGEDTKWLSPMTSGYYIGGLPKMMDKIYWYVSDIMHVCSVAKISTVVLAPDIPLYVSSTLALNKYFVIVLSFSPVHHIKYDVKLGTVVKLHISALSTILTDALYVDVGTKAAIAFNKDKLNPIPGIDNILQSYKVTPGKTFMTWVNVCHEVYKKASDCKYNLEYSVHAHAGVMIMTNAPVTNNNFTIDNAIRRIGAANSIKSWFPFSRYRMLEYDRDTFKFVNSATVSRVKYRFRTPPNATKEEMYEVDFDADMVEEIDIQPLEIRDADYENMFKQVPMPSGPKIIPPPLAESIVTTIGHLVPLDDPSLQQPQVPLTSAVETDADFSVEFELNDAQ